MGLPEAPAATNAIPQGSPTLTTAGAALEDGLYSLAEKQAKFLLAQSGRTPSEMGTAALIYIRALHEQERNVEILNLSYEQKYRDTPAVAGLSFWKAMALYDLGRYDSALTFLDALDAPYHASPYASRGKRLRAWCLLKIGKRTEALSIFDAFDKDNGHTLEGYANLLDWAKALMEAGDIAGSRQKLELLISRSPDSDYGQEGRLLLAQVLVRDQKNDKAWNILDIISTDKTVRPDRRAEAFLALAELNANQTNYEAGLMAIARAMELAPSHDLQTKAKVVKGRMLMKMGRMEDGTSLLKSVISEIPESPVASRLQLEIARSFLDATNADRAAAEYQVYLETFTNRTGQAEAATGKGIALLRAQRYAEAAVAFEKAYSLFEQPTDRAQALYKMGDAWFANNQFIKAAESYQKVLQEFGESELCPQALYLAGESYLRAGKIEEGERCLRLVCERYPLSTSAERSALRLAESDDELGRMDKALAGYSFVMLTYPKGALFARALQHRGLLLYRLLRFEEAAKDFQAVVETFPSSGFAEQANFMRGRCLYMMGRDAEALEACRMFVDHYPDSELTPDVLFWIGEYQFNRGSFLEAEKQFGQLSQRYPKAAAADDALLWAGRAAFKQKEYLRAVEHVVRLAKTYPTSSNLAEARFLQGDAMSELGDLANAILLFDEIITKYSTNTLVAAAWGRKGDCQFTLGVEDSRRYNESMDSYQNVIGNPAATPDLKLQADYKIGRCLEKLGRKDEALEHYYNRVVVKYLEDKARTKTPNTASAVWFTRAVFAVADLLEAQENWRRAVRVLQRVVDAGVPAAADAQERINRIRSEHWGLFY